MEHENFKLLISKLIITVVIVAAMITCLGGIIYLWHHGHDSISYQVFQGEPKPYTSVWGIWQTALSFSAKGLMQLGLLILVLGQTLRVLLTTWLFVKEKDSFFVWCSLFILAVLVYSLFGKI